MGGGVGGLFLGKGCEIARSSSALRNKANHSFVSKWLHQLSFSLDILKVFLHFEQKKIVCSAQKIIFSVLNCHTIFKATLKINKFKKHLNRALTTILGRRSVIKAT
jgi:hypothetical protein